MISIMLVRDGDGFEGRIIELHLFRKDVVSGEELLVSTYEIDTSQLTSGYALSKQKSSTILLSPVDIDDDDYVDAIIGQPDVLVTVGCAFVRNMAENEESEELHLSIISPVEKGDEDREHGHVDQYRALTMLYHEAGKLDDTPSVSDVGDDEDISGFLGEVDELIRGGDVWSPKLRQSPKLEMMRRRRLSSADSDNTEEALAAIREEERVMQELNLGLQQLHSLSKFDRNQVESATRAEIQALRQFFKVVLKVNGKARGMLRGAHTDVMNVAIMGEVVGASFSMEGGCVSQLSWGYIAPVIYDDSDDSDSDNEDGDDVEEDQDSSDEDNEEIPKTIEQVLTTDVSKALCPLSQLKSLVMGAECLSGPLTPLLDIGLEDLQLDYSAVHGALDEISELCKTRLRILKLRCTAVTSGSLVALGSCALLRILDLRQTASHGQLSQLSQCPLLENLLIDGTSICGDISWICQLRQLRLLSASNSLLTLGSSMLRKSGGDSAAGHVGSNLKYVDVSHTDLRGRLELLLDVMNGSGRSSPVLDHLDLTHCGLSGYITCLKSCPQLREVGLGFNPQLAGDLAECLPRDKLEYLDVRGTSISDIQNLADSLESVTLLVNEFPCEYVVVEEYEEYLQKEKEKELKRLREQPPKPKLPPPLPPHPQNINQRVRTI